MQEFGTPIKVYGAAWTFGCNPKLLSPVSCLLSPAVHRYSLSNSARLRRARQPSAGGASTWGAGRRARQSE